MVAAPITRRQRMAITLLLDYQVSRNISRPVGPMAEFLEKKEAEREPKTYAWHKESLMVFWEFLQSRGQGEIGDFNENTVNLFRMHLRKKGLSENTMSNRLRSLRAFANWMVKAGWVEVYPLGEIHIPQSTKPEFDLIPDEQRKALFGLYAPNTFLGSRNLAMLGVLSDTGLRREEVVNLESHNLDLDQGILKVHSDKTESWRYLPLTDEVAGILRNYLRWKEKYFTQVSRKTGFNRLLKKP